MVGVIIGELHKVPALLSNFPLLMSRTGRGVLVFLTGLVIWCLNGAVLILINPAMLIGLLNVWLGWGEDRVEIHMSMSETATETTIKQKPSTAGKTGDSDKKSAAPRDIEIEGFDQP